MWLEAGPRDMSDKYRIRSLNIEPGTYIDTLTADSLANTLSGQNPASYNRIANLITAILNMAVRREWLTKAPKIERKKLPPGTIRWLTPGEWARLQQYLTPHQRQMARMALATGLRQHNITHMRWDHIDITRRITWVDADQAKGRKVISVPLSDDAVGVLREQLGQSQEWVFPYRGKPVSEVKTAWRTAVERSGIPWVRWHDLRHTWASWHIQSGTPVEVLQKLGGWADLEMVMKYAHLHPSHLASYANNSKPGELKNAVS